MQSGQLCLRLALLVLCQRPAGSAALQPPCHATPFTNKPHPESTRPGRGARELTYTPRWHHSEPEGHLHPTSPRTPHRTVAGAGAGS